MELETRVFELYNGNYKNIKELARAMEISSAQVYRVRGGRRRINRKFIIGAVKAFPEYKLDDLFYVGPEGRPSQKQVRMSADNLRRMIKQQRAMRGLTLRQLADAAGVSPSHLDRIERGERFPSASTVGKIAKPLGFDEAELLTPG